MLWTYFGCHLDSSCPHRDIWRWSYRVVPEGLEGPNKGTNPELPSASPLFLRRLGSQSETEDEQMLMMIDFTQEIAQTFKFRKRVWVRLWNVNHLTFWFLNVFYLNQERQVHFGAFEGWKKLSPPKPSLHCKNHCEWFWFSINNEKDKESRWVVKNAKGVGSKGLVMYLTSWTAKYRWSKVPIINVWRIFKKSKHMMDTENINTDMKGSFLILKLV